MSTENLKLRMLGYYKAEHPNMYPESKEIEFANELSEKLVSSFDSIDDENDDLDFAEALKNYVFILRDRDFNLYAFWPKEGIVRITDVAFNSKSLTPLPVEYKVWFTPGENILINEVQKKDTQKVKSNFFDYIRTVFDEGQNLTVGTAANKKISGELLFIGQDFISIKDSETNSPIVISEEMYVRVSDISKGRNHKNIDAFMPATGVFRDTTTSGLYLIEYKGDNYPVQKQEILEPDLKPNSDVFFDTKIFWDRNKQQHRTIIAKVHSTGPISHLLDLAERNPNKANALSIVNHVLSFDPDNVEASLIKDNINDKHSDQEKGYLELEKANNLFNEKKYSDAISEYKKLLSKDENNKECILMIAKSLSKIYEDEQEPEKKGIAKKNLFEFVDNNYTKLKTNVGLNYRSNYYYHYASLNEYIKFVDEILQDPTLTLIKRAKFLYYKASRIHEEDPKSTSIQGLLEESLYLNPFENLSERLYEPNTENNKTIIEVDKDNFLFSQLQDCAKFIVPQYNQILSDDKVNFQRMNKVNESYSDYLLVLSTNADANISKDKYLAEYVSRKAINLSQKKSLRNNALYLWKNLFEKLSGFGYFVRWNLVSLISCVCDIPIEKKPALKDFYKEKPWMNRKTWIDMKNSLNGFSDEQKRKIIDVIKGNNDILKELSYFGFKEVKSNEYHDDNQKLKHFINNVKNKKNIAEKLLYIKSKGKDVLKPSSNFRNDQKWYSNLMDVILGVEESINELDKSQKKQKYNRLCKLIEKNIPEIAETPTEMGIVYMAVLANLHLGMEQAIDAMFIAPEISIQLDEEPMELDSTNISTLGFTITNGKDSAAAENIVITFISQRFISAENSIELQSLDNGENKHLSFQIKSNKINKKWKFLYISIECKYNYKGKSFSKIFPLTLLLRAIKNIDFKPIEVNPYVTSQTGIEPNNAIFVDRKEDKDEIVKAIINAKDSPIQYILYGQPRCGKSTLINSVKKELEDRCDDILCVYIKSLEFDEESTEADFYKQLLTGIRSKLPDNNSLCFPQDVVTRIKQEGSPFDFFKEVIRNLKESFKNTSSWENKRLVVIIDEFNYLISSIWKNILDKNIMQKWKTLQADNRTNFSAIFIGHDVTPTFLNESFVINSFRDRSWKKHLTYLKEKEAYEMIEKPTLIDGQSRFHKGALQRIYYYTGGNPFMIQHFMQHLVPYINENRISVVSFNEVDEIARRIINKQYPEYQSIESFDNLYNPGLEDGLYKIPKSDMLTVLRTIAKHSEEKDAWCNYDDKDIVESDMNETKGIWEDLELQNEIDVILQDLEDRYIIIRRDNNKSIKIVVGLFKEWLIKN